ncbi:MAG TPA: FecR family protein [Sphingobacteriaceae bacterium]
MENNTALKIGEAEIGKYLSGEASPDEAMLLEEWLDSSLANRELFNHCLQVNNSLAKDGRYQVPVTADAWMQLVDAIPELRRKSVQPTIKNLFSIYSIAACVTGLIILSAVLFFHTRYDDKGAREITYAATNNNETKVLPDSSEIILSSGSRLSFPEKFKPDSRETNLQGEAYFTITHNAAQPFIITVDNINIQVIGTSFNVKDLIDEGMIETQVVSGKVKMYNDSGEIIIASGQTGIYNKSSNAFHLEDTLRINRFSYATRNFNFINEDLNSIIGYLEKAYSTKIILNNPQLGNCKITCAFENKSIEYVLEVIAVTLKLTYKVNNGIIHIGGNYEGC